MGQTRHVGLGVHNDRDEEARRRKDEDRRYDNQVNLNKWAFRQGCLNRSRQYNAPDSERGPDNGAKELDGAG